MTAYVPEEFTSDEADVLRRYFTNLDGPVFALVNLPEVVKGALFARYSRSAKSLRRLFLDEFVGDLDISGDHTIDATVGVTRAEALYEKVFVEYGDDSVAQLGGVHLACEQASNLLTKVLEWGRLMSYLEQSTRYIAYDARLGGRYRFHRDPAVLASRLGTRYVGDMDRLFDAYSLALAAVTDHVRATVERHPDDSDFVFRQATRAKALDAVRGMLPAASLSNLGIYASGQAFEALLLRMRAHPLPEARDYAELMLHELRKVIPSFLRRVDVAERGGRWSTYLATTRERTAELVESLFGTRDPGAGRHRHARRLGPRRRAQAAGRDLLPALRPPGAPAARPGRPARSGRAPGARAGLRRRAREPPPQAGPGVRARRLPLRRAVRLRRVPRPPTAPPADHRVAAPDAAPRVRAPRARRRRRPGARLRRGDGPLGAALRGDGGRLPGAGRLRRVDGVPHALRDAVQRPRGDPPAGAALRRPGSPVVPAHRPGDAPADRRAGRPPRRRRGDDPPHDGGTRARAAGGERRAEARRST